MADGTARERHGCVCLVFVTETDGAQRGSYARCAAHKQLLEANRAGR